MEQRQVALRGINVARSDGAVVVQVRAASVAEDFELSPSQARHLALRLAAMADRVDDQVSAVNGGGVMDRWPNVNAPAPAVRPPIPPGPIRPMSEGG